LPVYINILTWKKRELYAQCYLDAEDILLHLVIDLYKHLVFSYSFLLNNDISVINKEVKTKNHILMILINNDFACQQISSKSVSPTKLQVWDRVFCWIYSNLGTISYVLESGVGPTQNFCIISCGLETAAGQTRNFGMVSCGLESA
jgi:hypothetical protein